MPSSSSISPACCGILFDALRGKAGAWRFILGVVLASLPAAIAGVLLHDFIKSVIYETPVLICVMLIVGGIILLYVDQLPLQPKYTDIYEYPPHLCFLIGLFQMLALVPGVSRSGATIVGALLLGTDKRERRRVHLLHRHADHDRRLRLRPLQEPRR